MGRPTDAKLLALIDAAYTASEANAEWERFLAALSETLGGTGALLLHHNLWGNGRAAVSGGIPADVPIRYDENNHPFDPWVTLPLAKSLGAPGCAILDEVLLPRTALNNTDDVRDFSGAEQKRLLMVMLQPHPTFCGISIYRDETDEPFGKDEVMFVEALVPHLRRAFQIHERLHTPAAYAHRAIDALEALACSVFVVDASARVLFANRAGRELLAARNGLSTDQSLLTTETVEGTKKLRALCAQTAASRDRTPAHYPGGAMAVRRRGSSIALQVVVAPLSPRRSSAMRGDAAAALVFATDPAANSRPSEELLQVFFGLTRAEAGIAARIGEGQSLEDIAAAEDYTLQTVQWYNKQILSKTGCRTRAALVRHLSRTLASLLKEP